MRRVGLGITGLADALAMLGLSYDSEVARQTAAGAMQLIRDAAYRASLETATERGPFPGFRPDAYLDRPFIRALPDDIRAGIRKTGIRNSHLTAIAPAGTISLLAGNVSSGIEPIFALEGSRRILDPDGIGREFAIVDYAVALWRSRHGAAAGLPASFVLGHDVDPRDQLLMQAALQPFVDGAISKTISLPDEFPASAVADLYASAYRMGLKGCTIYRRQARACVISQRDATPDRATIS